MYLADIFSDSNQQALEEDLLNSFRVNTLGLVHAVQAFIPLIRKSTIKKVVNISSAMADIALINELDLEFGGPYSASKAASNVIIAKYSAAYKTEGILFLSISPGYVATERNAEGSESEGHSLQFELVQLSLCLQYDVQINQAKHKHWGRNLPHMRHTLLNR